MGIGPFFRSSGSSRPFIRARPFPVRVEFAQLPDQLGSVVVRADILNGAQGRLELHSVRVVAPRGARISAVLSHRPACLPKPVGNVFRVGLPLSQSPRSGPDCPRNVILMAVRLPGGQRKTPELALRFLFKEKPKGWFERKRVYARFFRLPAPCRDWSESFKRPVSGA